LSYRVRAVLSHRCGTKGKPSSPAFPRARARAQRTLNRQGAKVAKAISRPLGLFANGCPRPFASVPDPGPGPVPVPVPDPDTERVANAQPRLGGPFPVTGTGTGTISLRASDSGGYREMMRKSLTISKWRRLLGISVRSSRRQVATVRRWGGVASRTATATGSEPSLVDLRDELVGVNQTSPATPGASKGLVGRRPVRHLFDGERYFRAIG